MSEIRSIQEVIRVGLCISCGACVSTAPPRTMKMVLNENRGTFIPKIIDTSCVSGDGREFTVCPGKGLPINKMAQSLYGSASHETFELGRYRFSAAARTTNPRILENASSGGVMTEIACYLLEKGLVHGVTASHFIYGPPGPRTKLFIARSPEDLFMAQGSKYCPTTTNQLVRLCAEAGGRYLFVGTPCQVGALRLAAQEDPSLVEVFPYTMANFCGGYRDFRYLDEIVFSHGIDPAEVEFFRFRGDGQPGSMLIRTREGQTASEPYPDYGSRSMIARQKRCWYCVDATGELADFACGDAWIPRFLKDEHSWSVILARSAFAEELISEMATMQRLKTEPVSFEEICESQRSNIYSKKFRQYGRIRVSRLLGITVPRWDVELPPNNSRYLYEIIVLLSKTRLGQQVRKIIHSSKRLLGRLYAAQDKCPRKTKIS